VIIGEAAKFLIKQNTSDILAVRGDDVLLELLRGAAKMRDFLVHHYWAIDSDVLLKTATGSLGVLLIQIEELRGDCQSTELETPTKAVPKGAQQGAFFVEFGVEFRV
jgi:uncharacterized protein with HEPN domain